jgi:predicted AAA+ superfamily ATPase
MEAMNLSLRYLHSGVARLAGDTFVLVSGPRQVGKTTLARAWLDGLPGGRYFNWDIPADRADLLRRDFPGEPLPGALVLDEIHKYPRWKSWLKGLYDQRATRVPTVVTGSARLDIYQRGGDSLLGRVTHLRLHPLTIGELLRGSGDVPTAPADWLAMGDAAAPDDLWSQLDRRSGFPEPFLRDDAEQHRRWSNSRRSLLVLEDLRDLTQIRQLALVEHLALLLPERVGSPLSVNALREDLRVGHDTVSAWLEALERLYYAFRIAPWTKRVARAITRERKLYLWDWSQVEGEGPRFENMVASHLLKAVHYWTDLGYGDYDLRYVRDREKREVDFVVTESRRPVVLVECKLRDDAPHEPLLRFQAVMGGIPAVQLVRASGVDRRIPGERVRVVSAPVWLAGLP